VNDQWTADRLARIAEMDDPSNMDDLAELGRKAAAAQIKPEHFPQVFDVEGMPEVSGAV
jgi:hypothetical protein